MSGTTPRTGDTPTSPVSMSDLLAATRAAAAVSTPPVEPAEDLVEAAGAHDQDAALRPPAAA